MCVHGHLLHIHTYRYTYMYIYIVSSVYTQCVLTCMSLRQQTSEASAHSDVESEAGRDANSMRFLSAQVRAWASPNTCHVACWLRRLPPLETAPAVRMRSPPSVLFCKIVSSHGVC